MAIRRTDLEAIPKIWGPDHQQRPKDYRVFEHAVRYQHFCRQQWDAIDVGANAVAAVAFDPSGALCALGCDHSLVVVLDATMEGLPVVLKLFDSGVYGHKASKGLAPSLDRFIQRCIDLRWTDSGRVVALYDCKARADRTSQSHFFVYDVHTASILHSVSFGDRFTGFELFDGPDRVIAALDDGNLCHIDLSSGTLAAVTVDDQAMTISEQRVAAHQMLSSLEKNVKRSLAHYSRLLRVGDDLLVYSMDKKRLRRVIAQRTVAAAAQMDGHDKSYSLRNMSVSQDCSRLVCVPERGWVQVLDVANLSIVASFGIDGDLYPGPICWAAGSFVHTRSKRGLAKQRLMLFVDHQSDYGLRDRAYLWKGLRDGKLEDERWTSAPRNVRALAASISCPVVVVADNKGGCYSLAQRMTTTFAGPMCPPGYEVIEECIKYYEAEDELDLEVYDKNSCEINVDELIYPKLRKSLVPSDDIWTARRRVLMRGWASEEPAEVDILTSTREEEEDDLFKRKPAFEPGRHCRLLRENYQAARELEVVEDGEAQDEVEVLEAKDAALGPFISLPQGIMSGSFAARMSKEAKAAEGLLTALQPERLEPKLQFMRAEAEKKYQRMQRAKEKKAQKREQEKQQREEELAKERAEREAAFEAAQRALDAKPEPSLQLQKEPSASSLEAMNGPDDEQHRQQQQPRVEEVVEEEKKQEEREEEEDGAEKKPAEAIHEPNGDGSTAEGGGEVPMDVAPALASEQERQEPQQQGQGTTQRSQPPETQVASSPEKESAAAPPSAPTSAHIEAPIVKQEPESAAVVQSKKQPTRSPPAQDPAPKRPRQDTTSSAPAAPPTSAPRTQPQQPKQPPPRSSSPMTNGHRQHAQDLSPQAQDPYYALLSGFPSGLPPSYMTSMQDPFFLAQMNTSSLWGTPAYSLLPGAGGPPPSSADSHFHPPRPTTSFHADHHHRQPPTIAPHPSQQQQQQQQQQSHHHHQQHPQQQPLQPQRQAAKEHAAPPLGSDPKWSS